METTTIVTEVVQMQTAEGVTEEAFLCQMKDLEERFHRPMPGYRDSELVRSTGQGWLLIMHWASREALAEASRRLMEDPSTEPFRRSLEPGGVRIQIGTSVARWQA